MTSGEKIDKVKELLFYNTIIPAAQYRSLAEKIVDALEEPDPPKFREHEIVWVSGIGKTHARYGDLDDVEKKRAKKLSTEEIAHTTAPPDMETWELYEHHIIFRDSDGALCTTPGGTVIRTYCPHWVPLPDPPEERK